MKELKGLERLIRIGECIHLALMTLCFTFSIALLFKEDDQLYRALWALGAVIPVELIRFICAHFRKKLPRFLLSLGVFALTVCVTLKNYHIVYYAPPCILILISGLFLPRSKGRLIFTIPGALWLLVPVLTYAVGQVLQVPLLSRLAIVLSALLTLNYFLYLNQTRLLQDICMSTKAEVSVTGLIRQNRKVVAIFLLAGVLVLTAIPFLLRAAPPETEDSRKGYIEAEATEPPPTPYFPKEYTKDPGGKPLHLDFLTSIPVGIAIFVFVAFGVFVIGGIGYLLYMLISSIDRRNKRTIPEIEDGMEFERIRPESAAREREHLTGYERKIRRRYEKLIRSRAPEKAALAAMTPTELEQTAHVTGDGADTIHEIYSRTRYSPDPATKERYTAFQEAVRALPAYDRTEH